MDENDKQDIHAGVVLHVSQADSRSTESDIKQEAVLSPVCATCPVPASIPATSCSCDCDTKCEHKLSESMHEGGSDSQKGHSVDDRIVSGLQGVRCEKQRQELSQQPHILPSVNTLQASTLSYDVNELTEVKLETKTEPDEYDGNCDETRHWIVCPGRILKEVKTEPTIDVPDILPVEDGSHNVDQKQLCGSSNHAKMECESQLNVHERNVTGVKPFACDTCGKSFGKSSALKLHERLQTCEKPYTCDTCRKSFSYSRSLIAHQRAYHGVKPYTCDTCGKSFLHSMSLIAHRRTHHYGVNHYTCDICGKSFASSSALKSHERVHTGVNPFTCDTCGKSFFNSSGLKVHERIHTGVKPYICDTCGKSFADPSNLRVHDMKEHTQVLSHTLVTHVENHSHSPVDSGCM